MVANQSGEGILLGVIEDEGEDAVQIVQKRRAFLLDQRASSTSTVGVGLELEVDLEVLQLLVVADLAVDGQYVRAPGL